MAHVNPSGEAALYLATKANDEAAVRDLLVSPAASHDQLNHIDSVNGWTPLFFACVMGLTSIAKLLLAAGSNQDILDSAGWTAREHAVFRGHLNLARLFARQDKFPSDRLMPRERRPINYAKQSDTSQVFVYLGPSHTRSSLAPVEIYGQSFGESSKVEGQTEFHVSVKSLGTSTNQTWNIQLPILDNMVNSPLVFSADDPETISLVFEVYGHHSSHEMDIRPLGTAVALLRSLREGFTPKHESITRHYTIPILQNSTMACIGSVTFSVLLITPFCTKNLPLKASPGFWIKDGSYPIVGHRGCGANSNATSVLQIGENTLQSFSSAYDRGASCVEFDVQLTKDYHPVIYHDFLVKETGGDIPLFELTFDQFQHFSRSQAPKHDQFGSGEQKYIEKTHANTGSRPKGRRHSLNEYDHSRSLDLLERIKYTDEGLRGNFKGNIRGCSIQEPSTTLEQLLTSLPDYIAFDLEIKYPMLWEAEDRAMEFIAIELNTYVDIILSTIFRHCGHRNITLTSFSPEVCIALVCKQRSFPVLMINKSGTVPVSDVRAGSLKGGIDFATAWDLDGIVSISDPFIMCPRLLTYAKDMGLVVASYGDLNNEPECALMQIKAGLDAIITDKAHLMSHCLAYIR